MKQLSIFWKYFISYLITLFIPFSIVSFFFYQEQTKIIQLNTEQYYQNMLISVKNYSDSMLKEIETTKYSIEHSLWLRDLCLSSIVDRDSIDASILINTNRSLSSLLAQSPHITSISLLLYDSSVLYTSNGVYDLKSALNHAEESEVSLFSPSETETPSFLFEETNNKKRLVYSSNFTNAFGTAYNNRPKGDLNITLSYRLFLQQCQNLLEDSVVFSIEQPEGNPFFTAPLSTELSYQSFLETSSSQGQISYKIYIPEDHYFRNLRSQQSNFLIFVLLLALFSIAITSLLAYYNSKPIRILHDRFSKNSAPNSKDELFHISESITAIQQRYADAERNLDQNRPHITHSLFFNLLYEKYDKTIEDELIQQHIVFEQPFFCVIAARLPLSSLFDAADAENPSKTIQTFKTTCQYYLSIHDIYGYVYELSSHQFGIILNFSAIENLKFFVTALANDCNECFSLSENHNYGFGIGNVYTELDKISISFSEASQALEKSMFEKNKIVVFYEDCADIPPKFYDYCAQDEAALLGYLKKGDVTRMDNTIDSIVKRNQKNGLIDIHATKGLHYQILSTLIKGITQMGLHVETYIDLNKVGNLNSFDEVSILLKEISRKVCPHVSTLLEQEAKGFEDALISFVNEHVFENSISLQLLADHYNVSMSYISQVFKKELGVPYSDYVNKTRIDQALKLRDGQKMRWDDISKQIGYESISTFRRNFIKYTGVTPGSYDL